MIVSWGPTKPFLTSIRRVLYGSALYFIAMSNLWASGIQSSIHILSKRSWGDNEPAYHNTKRKTITWARWERSREAHKNCEFILTLASLVLALSPLAVVEAWVIKPTEFTFSVASSLCWSEFPVVFDPKDWTLLTERTSGEPTITVGCLLGVTVLGTGRYVSSRLAMSSSSKKSKYILDKHYQW